MKNKKEKKEKEIHIYSCDIWKNKSHEQYTLESQYDSMYIKEFLRNLVIDNLKISYVAMIDISQFELQFHDYELLKVIYQDETHELTLELCEAPEIHVSKKLCNIYDFNDVWEDLKTEYYNKVYFNS